MIISQLVGHLLGDGSLNYSRTSVTPYFVFTQTIKRFEYIWHVYLTLSSYCGKVPFFKLGLRKDLSFKSKSNSSNDSGGVTLL